MKIDQNKELMPRSKQLRKNMTKEENALWYQFLRTCPVHFRRQQVIGNYIADFYCHRYKLVIELDGSQHYSPEAEEYDRKRDAYMAGLGITVLRYGNNDVNERFDAVCEDIARHIELM